jgi:hypothetical protein
MLLQLLTSCTLSVVLFFNLKQRFGDWTLSPSSDKKPTQLGPIDRASPYLRTQDPDFGFSPRRAVRIQSHVCSYGMCGGQVHWEGVLPSTLVSPANYRSTKSPIPFIGYPGLAQCAIYDLCTKGLSFAHPQNKNKKFWEELIASFPLIRYGPHRKRLQQFFVAAGTSLPNCYLAMIGGYTYRTTDSPLITHGPDRK